ncbi:MAG TPA: MlaD family protein [Candidatus Limnocylindria bacterium]|jgi:paraquat-inducible protein B|nr:MlaD family protein [Candidatus Limnocylindria bacterium]
MRAPNDNSVENASLPQAQVARPKRFNWIWIVPLLAAGIAGWLVYQNLAHAGSKILLRFVDGKGLQAGQTLIRYRGVRVGDVQSVELTPDGKAVEVKARLEKFASQLAREGAQFWIVRPDVGAGTLRGLETIVGGSYIQVQPGEGSEKKEFTGLEKGPVAQPEEGGIDILLTWPRLGWLNTGSPVYYRGVEVGLVQDYSLGEFATNIVIRAHIRPEFSRLVRTNTVFWNAGGIKADVSLFGVSVSAESLKSALVGGIAFATPSPVAPEGRLPESFPLHEKPEDKWLKWSPAIDIGAPYGGRLPVPAVH